MSKLAVLGHGVVGSGTVELFLKNKDSINRKNGLDLELGYILDIRDFPGLPYSDKFVKDINVILNDPEVTVAAEVMGGLHPAFEFVQSCLEKGISVATSNKELVAEKGDVLLRTAAEHSCCFMFEASTGGAIPVIRPLHTCLAGNEITAAAGILNGTTNFILTKMITDNMAFDEALKMAQELGYAEKDPTADVEGGDACRKICILSSLIFGKHVYPKWVHCEGITKLTPEDIAYADSWGGAVKLIASVRKLEDGRILPMVCPSFVCRGNQLSYISDVFNGVMIYGDGFDRIMLYGRGAGKLPTASAVLGDIIDCAKSEGTSVSLKWESSADNSFVADYTRNEVQMYVRMDGVSADSAKAAFGDIELLDREDKPSSEIAFVTPLMRECDIAEKTGSLGGKLLGCLRVLDL